MLGKLRNAMFIRVWPTDADENALDSVIDCFPQRIPTRPFAVIALISVIS
jgi:hypothetical protein